MKKKENYIDSLLNLHWFWLVILIIGILSSPIYLDNFINKNPNPLFLILNKKLMPEITWVLSTFLGILLLIKILKIHKKRKLFFNEYDLNKLKEISWIDFELLVTETFKRDGYQVKEAGGAQADGGIDLQAFKSGQKIIVQCKHWKKTAVGVSIVREMFGVGIHEQASMVYIVTCGYFTKDAKDFAKNKPIRLINGYQLLTWIENIKNR